MQVCDIGDEDIETICDTLEKNTNITALNLKGLHLFIVTLGPNQELSVFTFHMRQMTESQPQVQWILSKHWKLIQHSSIFSWTVGTFDCLIHQTTVILESTVNRIWEETSELAQALERNNTIQELSLSSTFHNNYIGSLSTFFPILMLNSEQFWWYPG